MHVCVRGRLTRRMIFAEFSRKIRPTENRALRFPVINYIHTHVPEHTRILIVDFPVAYLARLWEIRVALPLWMHVEMHAEVHVCGSNPRECIRGIHMCIESLGALCSDFRCSLATLKTTDTMVTRAHFAPLLKIHLG